MNYSFAAFNGIAVAHCAAWQEYHRMQEVKRRSLLLLSARPRYWTRGLT